jgi:hypothetical protein
MHRRLARCIFGETITDVFVASGLRSTRLQRDRGVIPQSDWHASGNDPDETPAQAEGSTAPV